MSYRYLIEIGNPITHRFSTAVRNEVDPSNATYPDGLGNNIPYPVRLAIPKANNKISDSISGASKKIQYKIEIENSDGAYDDVKNLGWFNIPVVLKRSNIENPLLTDFNIIMKGDISYPVVGEHTITLAVDNIFKSLTQEVCKTFNDIDYPNVFDNVKDKSIPIGYNDQLNVPVYRVDPSEYIALDKDYITAVSDVYDKDGNSIAFTFNPVNGQINAIDAVTADVTGRTNNKLGQIITTEIQEKSLILYDSDNWDLVETNNFIVSDSKSNFYFDGGSVASLVNAVLKNDNAFLFTKNNGLLTLRQWGRTYSIHEIDKSFFMKFPNRDYNIAEKYFNSSVVLKYERNINAKTFDNQVLVDEDYLHVKVKRSTYFVSLYTFEDLDSLANRLLKRFSDLSEIINLYLGQSVENINLLDTILIDLNINGRQFSNKTTWIVREVDTGQDVIVLESTLSAEDLGIIEGVLSQPFSIGFDGVLSQPMYEGIDGILSQPLSVTL